MAALGLVAAVTVFFDTGVLMTVLMFAAGIAFVLWIAAASVVMVTRPEVDRAGAAGTAFAN